MKKKKQNRRQFIAVIIGIACLFFFLYRLTAEMPEQNKPEEAFSEQERGEQETAETEEVKESGISEETEYEKPSYEFHTEDVTVKIKGLTRAYTLAWVSDLHLITDKKVSQDILQEDLESIQQRYETLSVTEEGVHGEDLWPEIIQFLNYGRFDGVIFGGDILDYYSASNMEAFLKEYRKLNPETEVLYLRADHDYGAYYGGDAVTEEISHEAHKKIDGDDLEQKYLNFHDEFLVIGVNNSTKNLPREQMRIIREQSELGIPVILATHVPFASQIAEEENELAALSMQVRNKIYYWGGPDYQANEVTQELLDKIYWEHTPVKQVLAGHLHAAWDGMLTEKVPQHIFAPAFRGNIGIIHVVPKE